MGTTTVGQVAREVYAHPLTEDQKKNQLTAQDRCDRCGAQAYYIAQQDSNVTKDGKGVLLFCKHDFDQNEDALFLQGFYVIDQSCLLDL